MDVLLVGNEDLVRLSLSIMLGDAGLDVAVAADAAQAFELAQVGRAPAVLVTDVKLGCGMGGLALATATRRRWPCVSTVLISGADAAASALGRDDGRPPKPFRLPLLVRLIAEIAAEQAAAHRSFGHMAEANPRDDMNRGDMG
jgi:DNA-binding NtrC family response regulator